MSLLPVRIYLPGAEGPAGRMGTMSRVKRGPTWTLEAPRPAQTWDRVALDLIEDRSAPRDQRAKPNLDPRPGTGGFNWKLEGLR